MHSIPHLLSGQPQYPILRTPHCINALACQRHLEATMIWKFMGKNILLFKSYYRGGLIAAGGNIPGETNHSSWHHQTGFPEGGRGIPHPFGQLRSRDCSIVVTPKK